MREELAKLGIRDGQRVAVDAIIVGGRTGQNYGVWLDVPVNDDDEDDDEEEDEDETPVVTYQPPPPPPRIVPTTVGAATPASWREPTERKPVEPLRGWGDAPAPVAMPRPQPPAAPKRFQGRWVIFFILLLIVIVLAGVVYARTVIPPAAPAVATEAPAVDIVFPSPTPDATPVPRPTPTRPRATNLATGTVTLTCADCAAAGIAPNIWRTPQMQQIACRLTWGQRVERLSHRPDNGGMSEIRAPGCQGWIKDSLIR